MTQVTRTHEITLASNLVKELTQLLPNKKGFNNAVRFINYLQNKAKFKTGGIYNYIFIDSKTELENLYGTKYVSDFLNILLDNKIVFRTYYSIENSKSFDYRINEKYSIDDIKDIKTIAFTYKEDIKTTVYASNYKNTINKLNINYDELLNILNEKVNNISINDFLVNDQIKRTYEKTFNVVTNSTHYLTIEKALEIANENKLSVFQDKLMVIQDKKTTYIDSEEHFIKTKKSDVYLYGLSAINNLKNGNLFCKRGRRNKRLDTNFTNLNSELSNYIFKSNNYSKLDLSNSQFTIFANIFSNKFTNESSIEFCNEAKNGKLYELIENKLDLSSRAEAKGLMFMMFFSSERKNTEEKKLICKHFPEIYDFISEYKKANGYKAFSIMLQKEESKIFITDILNKLIRRGIPAITIHDSISVPTDRFEETEAIVNNYLKSINFVGTFKKEINKKEETIEVKEMDIDDDVTVFGSHVELPIINVKEITAQEQLELDWKIVNELNTLTNFECWMTPDSLKEKIKEVYIRLELDTEFKPSDLNRWYDVTISESKVTFKKIIKFNRVILKKIA